MLAWNWTNSFLASPLFSPYSVLRILRTEEYCIWQFLITESTVQDLGTLYTFHLVYCFDSDSILFNMFLLLCSSGAADSLRFCATSDLEQDS